MESKSNRSFCKIHQAKAVHGGLHAKRMEIEIMLIYLFPKERNERTPFFLFFVLLVSLAIEEKKTRNVIFIFQFDSDEQITEFGIH